MLLAILEEKVESEDDGPRGFYYAFLVGLETLAF